MSMNPVNLSTPRRDPNPDAAGRPAGAGSAAAAAIAAAIKANEQAAEVTVPQTASIADRQRMLVEANRQLEQSGSELTITFDDELNRTIFKIVDKKTREVVRTVPSEEALVIARALANGKSTGILLRGSA